MLFAHACALLLAMYVCIILKPFLYTDFKNRSVFSLVISIQWLTYFDWYPSPAPRIQWTKVTISGLRWIMFTICTREYGEGMYQEWKYWQHICVWEPYLTMSRTAEEQDQRLRTLNRTAHGEGLCDLSSPHTVKCEPTPGMSWKEAKPCIRTSQNMLGHDSGFPLPHLHRPHKEINTGKHP